MHDLIPNLAVLDRLLAEKTPRDRASAVQRETEQLPYYLRGACAAIRQLESARVEAVKVLEEPAHEPGVQVILPADKLDPLSFALDFYLFCMRRTFDALVPYLSRCPANLSLPSTLNRLVDGIKKNKWRHLDPEIRTILLDCWDDVGSRIKAYRDRASHTAIILSNCIAFNGTGGVRGLKALLPDDPDEKRPSELRYEPGVPAMGFALESLGKTIRFVNALVERMIDLMSPDDPNARSAGIVSPAMRGAPLKISSQISGEPVPFPVDVAKIVTESARRK